MLDWITNPEVTNLSGPGATNDLAEVGKLGFVRNLRLAPTSQKVSPNGPPLLELRTQSGGAVHPRVFAWVRGCLPAPSAHPHRTARRVDAAC